ncbi:Lipopolysaccharide kinase (Kdo/WaaP) family protein [Methylophilus rhizosphaerae]|uniref:Lipopolysaccharide kinase (Kdo/WaaP) family protein n=1 Tax=Methylophilus rhizosphaerae TaxID=492660 RepID=A0A1G9BL95_9PROT|nr:Lipopolysaccharide kinase (Kdo/WaaP) family protein [Methylophilus rhizosphaerae]
MPFILKQTSYHYLDPLVAPALAAHDLAQFEALWNREIAWFEEPNQRRGGWSGVGRLVLQAESAEPLVLFVKKQQNHGRLTWRHPWRGEPTFRREFNRLRQLAATGIHAPRVVAYAEAIQSGQQCAVLVTENLHDFVDLETLLPSLQQWPRTEKTGTLRQLAQQVRRFHDLGLVHRALYPKHLFVRGKAEQAEIALIDLEKARSSLCASSRMLFDLSALQRHTPLLTRSQRLLFFKHYLGLNSTGKLSWFERWCLTRIMRRSRR